MIKYISEEFGNEVKKSIDAVEGFESHGGIYFEFGNVEDVGYEDEDLIIDENYTISMIIDYQDEIKFTLREFIDLVNEMKETNLQDKLMYSSEKKSVVRISIEDVEDFYKIDTILDDEKRIFINKFQYKSYGMQCSIKRKDMLFSMLVAKSGEFDKYNPCYLDGEFYIEILPENAVILSRKEVEEICNAYIFEINASYKFNIELQPRPEIIEEYYNEDDVEENEYKLRPLMFGKGMNNVVRIFNKASSNNLNYDFTIQEYTKVIEYVSQTVIRLEIIEEANKKLYSTKALNPDANYIKELEDMFIGYKNKYDTDRSAIKATIKKCCDILKLVGYAPKCLKKINDLEKNISKPKANVEEIKNKAYDSLADVISDTRNSISHAKANYNPTGNECPENEKQQYVKMLRLIAIQIIRWFYKVNESSRIV